MAKQKAFEKYKGEQVNQIPAGYVESMGAIGRAYAQIGETIGKAITSAAQTYQQDQEIKSQSSGVVDSTNSEIKRFIDSGDLIVGKDGKVVPAPGKESMFNTEKLNDSLSIYNITKGRSSSELSGTEARGVLGQYKTISERNKEQREQRVLELKENEARLAAEKEDKKFRLDAYLKSSELLTKVREANTKTRGQEVMSLGSINPQNEANRIAAENAASNDVQLLRRGLDQYLNPEGQPSATAPAPANAPTQPPRKTEDEPTPEPALLESPPPEDDSVSAPAAVPKPVEMPKMWTVDSTTGATIFDPNGQAPSDDPAQKYDVKKTSTDDAYLVGNANSASITIGKSTDGRFYVSYNNSTTSDAMPVVKDVLIAQRLIDSKRVSQFKPSQEQLDSYDKLVQSGQGSVNNYPDNAEGGMLWKRAMIASLVAQGKMAPAPGQNREWLGQGEETIVAFSDTSKPAANPERNPIISEVTAPSSVPGMSGLISVAPSQAILENFRRAGFSPDAEQLAQMRLMDSQANFANQVIVDQARARESAANAALAKQTSLKEVGETASTFATLGTKIGEALTGYPGAFEPSGLQYGYFSRELPSNVQTGKRWTKGEIAFITSNLTSDNPETQRRAIAALPGLRADLARGAIGDKPLKDAAKHTADFDNTMSALEALNIELDRQIGEGKLIDFVKVQLDNIGIGSGAAELRSEKIHQLFLMGSLRQPIVGPGNPAIYEQLLLQEAIPDIRSFFRIPQFEQRKLQTLALTSASSYIVSMREAGLQPTPDSVRLINEKLSAVYGPKFRPFSYEELVGNNGWVNARTSQGAADRWLRSQVDQNGNRLYMTREELRRSR
jgi:hypothetical protein